MFGLRRDEKNEVRGGKQTESQGTLRRARPNHFATDSIGKDWKI
jgi:hypothetical protein